MSTKATAEPGQGMEDAPSLFLVGGQTAKSEKYNHFQTSTKLLSKTLDKFARGGGTSPEKDDTSLLWTFISSSHQDTEISTDLSMTLHTSLLTWTNQFLPKISVLRYGNIS